ncbi:hypothetical protein ElyMa_007067800 [Elysia marginata]|uniref:Uncharacterized protein n=1 Tax=Elysia marginata TaxID=1093978 RepID=A0AAV4JXW9_9GAST|nr:hypothetical protein ElyMa_007067800 [Elysia marginata]
MAAATSSVKACMICKSYIRAGEKATKLTKTGSDKINNCSIERCDPTVVAADGQYVHPNCRLWYTNAKNIRSHLKEKARKESSSPACGPQTRSSEPVFVPNLHCLFCGMPASAGICYKKGNKAWQVRTKPNSGFQASIIKTCKERGDDWAHKVMNRIKTVCNNDLFAADVIYHHRCSSSFRTGRQVPVRFSGEKKAKSQPPSDNHSKIKLRAFEKVCQYLQENGDEQTTVGELYDKMKEYCGDGIEPYTRKHLKQKLLNFFGTDIMITSRGNKTNVVTLRIAASKILNDFFETPRSVDLETIKKNIIETAARLIKNDINSVIASKDNYPKPEEIGSLVHNIAFVPDSLQFLLKSLFCGKDNDLKIASVGQAIMQATRPRAFIAPLQIGLSVQMHHQFASKFLLDTLYQLGFSSSYSETKRFELCAALAQQTDVPGVTNDHFLQYVADNVDHDLRTLDGLNTFHGMGIITAVTPGTRRKKPIPRLSTTSADLTPLKSINVHFFPSTCQDFSFFKYLELEDFSTEDPLSTHDLVWKLSWPLRSPRPAWQGFMQTVCTGEHSGKSSIFFLPMIDLNPSDMSCVYSTLLFVAKEAKRHNKKPVLTFDQPLWWKAQMIVLSEPSDSELKSFVLRLGGFHTLMSFLGAIGKIMAGSGLEEVLQVVYGSNTVTHMLSGKAISRAIRGHLLVDAALNAMLTAKAFGLHLSAPGSIPTNQFHPGHEFEDEVEEDTDGCLNDEDPGEAEMVDEVTERVMGEPGEGFMELEDSARSDQDSEAEEMGHDWAFSEEIVHEPCTFSYTKEESKDVGTGVNGNNQSHDKAQDFGEFGGLDKDQETDNDIAFESGEELPYDLREALERFDSIMNGESQTKPNIVFDRVKQQLCKTETRMADHRTAKLWLQYLRMLDILRKFLRAERTGNWHLHLMAMREMLPFLAASGHNLYTKSVYIYLQQMQVLPLDHPEVYESFCSGQHVIREATGFGQDFLLTL